MSDTTDTFPGNVKILCVPGCEDCKKELKNCKGLEDPAMDGVHWYDGRWICDECLQEIGRKELDEDA
jgi:hypothetical protein